MAITINQQPNLWSPVYNPMVCVISSTNVGQPNFKYLFDIYISGQTDYIRLAVDPDPSFSDGVADISPILERYVNMNHSHDIEIDPLGFIIAQNSQLTYEVKYGEQYGVASAVTDYPQLVMSTPLKGFNGVYSPHDFIGNFSGSSISVESTGLCLTSMPTTLYSYMTGADEFYLHYINNTANTVWYLQIKTYNSSGALIQTCRVSNAYRSLAAYTHNRMYVGFGATTLNTQTLSTGSQPVVDSNVEYYTVDLVNQTFVSQLQSVYTVRRNNRCQDGRVQYKLHFLNRKGGFDSYEFTSKNKYKRAVDRTKIEKKLGTRANNSWAYTNYDAGVMQINTTVKERYDLVTDWLTDADSYWLMELIESPVVFLQLDQTDMFLVTITNPSEIEYKLNNTYADPFTLTVTVEVSQITYRQRG